MAFRFTLASLLRLRQAVEHQRALDLQRAALNLVRAQNSLTQLDRFLDESVSGNARSLAAGCAAAELHYANLVREQLQQLRVQQQAEIARLETIRQRAARSYRQALHEREALETLRSQQQREYQIEQTRRRQQELDATYLLQRWHNRNG